MTYAFLRPIRSPTLLPMRMNAAETRASSAIADCTPLTVVPRSFTTAEIDTFINDVSTTSTNIAIARSTASRLLPDSGSPAGVESTARHRRRSTSRAHVVRVRCLPSTLPTFRLPTWLTDRCRVREISTSVGPPGTPEMTNRINYAKSGDAHVAYQVLGA